jgi:hypothetical protein
MNIGTRWATLFAACGGAAFAARLLPKSHNEKQAHKSDLHDWENKGGNPTPPPKAPDTLHSTRSA